MYSKNNPIKQTNLNKKTFTISTIILYFCLKVLVLNHSPCYLNLFLKNKIIVGIIV